jgi:hypothetical protein
MIGTPVNRAITKKLYLSEVVRILTGHPVYVYSHMAIQASLLLLVVNLLT